MNTLLLEALSNLKSPRVFVLGDLILDRYVWGSVSRVSPEAPVQILKVDREEHRLGGASNVACNLVALGARVSCGGVVGCDRGGKELVGLLRSWKADVSAVVWDPRKSTPIKTRMIAHNQQMLRVDSEKTDPVSPEVERRLLVGALRQAARSDLVIISDYSKGTLTSALCEKFVYAARCPILVGLKGQDYRKYAHATGAFLNRAELQAISHEDGIDAGAKKVLRELKIKFLVVTLGAQGMRVYKKAASFTLPAVAHQVYDVTGAGDTALAAFGLAFASGLSLERCTLLSNAAASVVVEKVGTATVTQEELRSMASGRVDRRKIVKPEELFRALERERIQGRKIVFTNGCYDLFHSGHVSSLQFARSQGDILVVGLNSDRSVRALKGKGRPIVPQADRALVLAALEAVDYVVLFDEDTPARLIRRIRPYALVKGADYQAKRVVGREDAGRVELAPLVEGISSSEIIRRIRGLDRLKY